MLRLPDRKTYAIITSAFAVALLSILPESRTIFPFWVIAAGLFIADTLFHEMGHTLFSWLFGQPAIPMILTLFGADQSGGMSMRLDHSWIVQIGAWVMLVFGCYWTKENTRFLFIPAIIFSFIVTLLSCTHYREAIISYMGHGGSICMGGFFLFRAWIYLDARNQYERWLNGLLGFFLTLNNMYFSYGLVFNAQMRGMYNGHIGFGGGHDDFAVMADLGYGWTVHGIALLTIVYGLVVIVGSFALALFLSDEFDNT